MANRHVRLTAEEHLMPATVEPTQVTPVRMCKCNRILLHADGNNATL